jgi:hypothetical protein
MDLLNFLKELLGSPAGSFAFVGGLLGLAFFVTWKVSHVVTTNGHVTGTCTSIKEEIQRIFKEISAMSGRIEYLSEIAKTKTLIQAHSPLSLTTLGQEMATSINAETLVEKNWNSKILPALKADLGKANPYDVQEYCMKELFAVQDKFFDQTSLEQMKLFAFKKGDSLFGYFQVIGIIIRDKYLNYLGIDISEIDQHDPSKQ